MPYYRITYQWYIEGEYESEEAAKKVMLDSLEEVTPEELTVETFNEEKGEWE